MHTSKFARRAAVLAVAGLLAAVLPLLAQGSRQIPCGDSSHSERARHCEIREQALPATGSLAVDAAPNGGVTVTGWDRHEVQVQAKVVVQAETAEQARAIAAQVHVLTDGGRIRAEGPERDEDSNWSVSFTVMAPSQGDLDVKTVNGGISLANVRGRLAFRTTNGGIKLENVNGDVRGSTKNGGLQVTLDGAGWDGEGLDVETHNGGVHVAVPDGYSAHLEVSTVNGGIRTGVPVTVHGSLNRSLSTDLGRGGAPIRVRTTNGGVRIEPR